MNFEEFRDQFAKGLMGGGYVRGLTTYIYNCVVALMNFYTETIVGMGLFDNSVDGTEWQTNCDALGHGEVFRRHDAYSKHNTLMNVALFDCGCMHISNIFTGVNVSMCPTHAERSKTDESMNGGSGVEVMALIDPEHIETCALASMMVADKGTTIRDFLDTLEQNQNVNRLLKDVDLS